MNLNDKYRPAVNTVSQIQHVQGIKIELIADSLNIFGKSSKDPVIEKDFYKDVSTSDNST